MGRGVSPDKYCPRWIAINRTIASWSGAHSCGDAHHNCTFVRFCAQGREDVQGADQYSNCSHAKCADSGQSWAAFSKTKNHSATFASCLPCSHDKHIVLEKSPALVRTTMGQQRGTYYWDDDSLSPGNRSDGGWSQNLYDQNGHLREHGTFFPDLDSDESDSTYSPYGDPPMFMSSETRLESDDEDDVESEEGTADGLAILLTIVGAAAVAGAAYAAAPPPQEVGLQHGRPVH